MGTQGHQDEMSGLRQWLMGSMVPERTLGLKGAGLGLKGAGEGCAGVLRGLEGAGEGCAGALRGLEARAGAVGGGATLRWGAGSC
jgi:hypothetical protein